MSDEKPKADIGTRLQSLPRQWLFAILFFAASIPLFIPVALPNSPQEPAIAFYRSLMSLHAGDKVLIASDWTLSTRAESGGEMEALLRILMRKGVKFAVYATADVNAPSVARLTIADVAKDEAAHGQPFYKPFTDYVVTGFYPNSEGTTLAINNNVLSALGGSKDYSPAGVPTPVLQSPVFQGIKSVSDFKYLIMITASNTERITFQRVKNTPLLYMVTGVMAPEDQVYFASGQLKGLIGGVKGVFDLETLMSDGAGPDLPGFKGLPDAGRGTKYYLALHFCLALLVIAVLVGNVGMWLSKKKGGK